VKKKPLKIFVWDDFNRDYSAGLAVAIARTEKQARKLVSAADGISLDANYRGELKVFPLKPSAFAVSGGS
jgi:hypothetical protein